MDADSRQRTAPLAGKSLAGRLPTRRICASGLALKPSSTGTHVRTERSGFRGIQLTHESANYGMAGFFAAPKQALARID